MIKDQFPSKLLEEAVDALGSLPGVGSRSALRLALHLLRQPSENVHRLTSAIDRLRDDAAYCPECRMISDGGICSICSDGRRDHSMVCVVENVRDVMSIERTGQYRGVYHVLGGIIDPIGGIGPSDLTIKELAARAESMAAGGGGEIIFALPGDVEGETTAFYIYRMIEKYGLRISSIARGLGFGDNLEYADELTLGRSIAARQPFKP